LARVTLTSISQDRVLVDAQSSLELKVALRPLIKAEAWTGACARFNEGVLLTGEGDERFERLVPVTAVLGVSLFKLGEQRTPGALRIINLVSAWPVVCARAGFRSETHARVAARARARRRSCCRCA
jgi:hypothetical protein